MAIYKKRKNKVSNLKGRSAWVLTFTKKNKKRFKKQFKSEKSMDRAIRGWRNAGGSVRWTPNVASTVIRSRGKRR